MEAATEGGPAEVAISGEFFVTLPLGADLYPHLTQGVFWGLAVSAQKYGISNLEQGTAE